MLCIHSHHHDPFHNLATEEYLLRNSMEDVFMLWQSHAAVVVGKHQNTLAEINYRFIRKNDIPVARRLTGGGTVYHDPGNINFTFIRKGEPGKFVDFEGFAAPVIDFLKARGIYAYTGPRHEILIDGKKISGNAEHVFRDRVLHHGTLLYCADLSWLVESIKPGTGRYVDKAVQSNRSQVMNLQACFKPAPQLNEFTVDLFGELMMRFKGNTYIPGKEEESAIRNLAQQKYKTWDWIYGWSPDYLYHNDLLVNTLRIQIELKVHRGIIVQCRLSSDASVRHTVEPLAASLLNTAHEENNIREKLKTSGFSEMMSEGDFDDLLYGFFG